MELGNVGAAQNVYQTSDIENQSKVNSFKAKVDLSDPVDTVEFSNNKNTNKKEASTLQKVALGVSSYIFPGLGQIINGQPLKGTAYFAAAMGIATAAAFVFPPAMTVASLIGIASAVDAVKNI